MARQTGRIIDRGLQMWMVRIYLGRDPESGKRRYIGKSNHGGLRAQRMILPHPLLRRQITEHIRLLMIDSAHASFLPNPAVELERIFQDPAKDRHQPLSGESTNHGT